jgi:hypothetical protein
MNTKLQLVALYTNDKTVCNISQQRSSLYYSKDFLKTHTGLHTRQQPYSHLLPNNPLQILNVCKNGYTKHEHS